MNTSLGSYFNFSKGKVIANGPSIDRPMSIIGRQNVENAKWAINALARSLNHAVKEYDIPATVSHFLSPRYPYDLAIRPLPGAIFRPVGVNSLFWTKTEARGDALFWSREFNGWRSWPREQPDKVMSLTRWVNLQDPYGQATAWLAITTKATSDEGNLLCRWAPMSHVAQIYARQASLPLAYLATCPSMVYDAKAKRFVTSPELLAEILGVKGVAS